MRKHAGSTPPFTVTTLRDITTTNSLKKQSKTQTTATQSVLTHTRTHTAVISAKVKSLAWEAYCNELEFE